MRFESLRVQVQHDWKARTWCYVTAIGTTEEKLRLYLKGRVEVRLDDRGARFFEVYPATMTDGLILKDVDRWLRIEAMPHGNPTSDPPLLIHLGGEGWTLTGHDTSILSAATDSDERQLVAQFIDLVGEHLNARVFSDRSTGYLLYLDKLSKKTLS